MRRPDAVWQIGGGLLVGMVVLVAFAGTGPIHPAVWTSLVLIGLGILSLRLPGSLPRVPVTPATITLLIAMGLAMRLVATLSDPLLEIDFYRYLWDGAAVSHGLNPFAVSPEDVLLDRAPEAWRDLGAASGGVVGEINYPHLRTIYPPVAQAAFALAHMVDPWGLTGLRLVMLAAEGIGLALLLQLLRDVGRSPLWAALYWWNPLVVKELANSAHMDALLVPFLLAFVLLISRGRRGWAALALVLAAGVKVWPILLMPVVVFGAIFGVGWRRGLVLGAGMVSGLAILALPVILGRLDGGSGFVAYAGGWERNDALFGVIRWGMGEALAALDVYRLDPGRLSRLLIAGGIGVLALVLALRPGCSVEVLVPRILVLVAALLLLSPTGYPWYFTWLTPFLALVPSRGLLLLGALFPLYYLRFAMVDAGMAQLFDTWIVWIAFGPVLALLARDAIQRRAV